MTRQRCAAVAAALAAGVGSLVLAVGDAAAHQAPTASTAPPAPEAGTYSGHTSQGLRFSLQVGSSRAMLSSAQFSFRVRCADHRTLQFSVAPILAQDPWRLNASGGRGFTRTFQDTSGERYWLSGKFAASGMVSGTLMTSWSSPHDGMCRSGQLTWHASVSH